MSGKGEGIVVRRIVLVFFVLFLSTGTRHMAAGRADVADAVMKRDKVALRALLEQKADVNAAQVDGATALHWAVYHDDREAVVTKSGEVPLHLDQVGLARRAPVGRADEDDRGALGPHDRLQRPRGPVAGGRARTSSH